jgi:hypothetical protein
MIRRLYDVLTLALKPNRYGPLSQRGPLLLLFHQTFGIFLPVSWNIIVRGKVLTIVRLHLVSKQQI